jgi:hypothetical protein
MERAGVLCVNRLGLGCTSFCTVAADGANISGAIRLAGMSKSTWRESGSDRFAIWFFSVYCSEEQNRGAFLCRLHVFQLRSRRTKSEWTKSLHKCL